MERLMVGTFAVALGLALTGFARGAGTGRVPYPIVDTGQVRCYGTGREIAWPKPGDPFYGQDAQYAGNAPRYRDNGDGTVCDLVTGLVWQKGPGEKKTWARAAAGAKACRTGGHTDWRLPNAKELQSIVDYTRSPDTTKSAAIDPVFKVTAIRNEGGAPDFPWYWTGTTHAGGRGGPAAAYVAFGRALGWMQGRRTGRYALMDVHGAGSQRSDHKIGDPADFPRGRGPQGDVIRICNYGRCVRGGGITRRTGPRARRTGHEPDLLFARKRGQRYRARFGFAECAPRSTR
jgi:hypothetical protein